MSSVGSTLLVTRLSCEKRLLYPLAKQPRPFPISETFIGRFDFLHDVVIGYVLCATFPFRRHRYVCVLFAIALLNKLVQHKKNGDSVMETWMATAHGGSLSV